ncbi:hypothetical protein [Streptomyces sp. NPDC001537]
MEILPPRPARVACAAPWVVPAAGAVVFGAGSADALSWNAAGLVLALSVMLAVRGYRIGVRCEATFRRSAGRRPRAAAGGRRSRRS